MWNAPSYAEAGPSADRASIHTVGRFDSRHNSFEFVLAQAQRYADPTLAVHPAFRVTQSEMELEVGIDAVTKPANAHLTATEELPASKRCADQANASESKMLPQDTSSAGNTWYEAPRPVPQPPIAARVDQYSSSIVDSRPSLSSDTTTTTQGSRHQNPSGPPSVYEVIMALWDWWWLNRRPRMSSPV